MVTDWDLFVASPNVVDLLEEIPGGRRDRAMRAVHAAWKREVTHPLVASDWGDALDEAAEWNRAYADRRRTAHALNERRRQAVATRNAASAAHTRGHAA